jgi:hypothetical protein
MPQLEIITAVHEAGHAYACVVLGVPFKHVYVKANDTGVSGMCTHRSSTEFDQIVICLAGQAAENIILGVDDPKACAKDVANANAYLSKWEDAPAKDLEPYRAFARCLVRTHERRIIELAKLLLQHGEITAELVERLAHDHGIH